MREKETSRGIGATPGLSVEPAPHVRMVEDKGGRYGWYRVKERDGSTVAYVPDETTAREFAAAPEMLELLALAYDAYMGLPAGEDWPERARAALSKARGEDPENPGGCFCPTCGLPMPKDGPCRAFDCCEEGGARG